MPARAVPGQGDIVWIELEGEGHEKQGKRPVLVISVKAANQRSGLAMLCPITNQIKRYPFEVVLPDGLKTSGVILTNQARTIDWKARKARVTETIPPEVLHQVIHHLLLILREARGN